jgi:HK97 family phage major capsid protein
MNAETFGLVLTLSDANGRPLMLPSPVDGGQYTISGSPVQIVSQMAERHGPPLGCPARAGR